MSNLSQSLFTDEVLHRGIHGTKVNEPLGMHWSEEGGVHALTEGREPRGAARFLGRGDENLTWLQGGEKGTVIHAQPQRGADRWTNKDRDFLAESGVIGAMSHEDDLYDEKLVEKEAEVPLRPGKKVKVTGLTRVRATDKGYKTRKITYQPPRIKTV